jgi:glycerate kinase
MILNVWFTVLLALVMTALIAALVYIIIALIQIRKTARQAELVLQKVNDDLAVVNKVSGKVADITEKVSAPVISVISALYYIVSSVVKKNKRRPED